MPRLEVIWNYMTPCSLILIAEAMGVHCPDGLCCNPFPIIVSALVPSITYHLGSLNIELARLLAPKDLEWTIICFKFIRPFIPYSWMSCVKYRLFSVVLAVVLVITVSLAYITLTYVHAVL